MSIPSAEVVSTEHSVATKDAPHWLSRETCRLHAETLVRWGVPLLAFALVKLTSRPAQVTAQGWQTTAVFAATMVAFALRPLPPAVVVLGALTVLAGSGAGGPERALAGYAAPGVWLVVAAMILSRALRDSGLARRVALHFVRRLGTTSPRLAGALVLSDALLAAFVPSVTARNAGIVLPIGVGLAEFYESRPGPSAGRLGAFLVLTLYQGSSVVCAMFLTGQASNVLAASIAARELGVAMSWSSWFIAALVPALVSGVAIIAVVQALARPSVRATPQAVEFAAQKLAVLGRMKREEVLTLTVTLASCLLFASSRFHHLEPVAIALLTAVALLGVGAVPWAAVLADKTLWDVFVWYGGLFSLAQAVASSGTPAALASRVSSALDGTPPLLAFVLASGVAYLAHYLFASITAQVLTMFLPLVLVLIHTGVPPALACYGMIFAFNLSAGLTHYGATNGPVLFAADYVSARTWWRVGFVVGALNLVVWLSVGLVWWRVLGLW